MSKFLDEKVKPIISPIHLASTLLFINYRQFKFIEDEKERENSLNIAKKYIKENISTADIQQVAKDPSAKKLKCAFGEDSDDELEEDQLEMYLKLKCNKFDNPLDFYRSFGDNFSNLTDLALQLFSKAASSSLSEKSFSIAGKINRPDRAHFKSKNLSLLVILAYAKKCEDLFKS